MSIGNSSTLFPSNGPNADIGTDIGTDVGTASGHEQIDVAGQSSGPAFVHLRVHSEYSIVDGLVRIDDIVAAAAKDKQPALAITDLSNLFGMVKFYKAARGKGVKPVAGCDVWITNDDVRDKPSRLLLLAKNHMGYLQLCALLSKAWLTNQNKGRAEIRLEWLQALAASESTLSPGQSQANGLIVLSGAHFGDVGSAIENGNLAGAERCAQRWAALFPGHFYIEIQRAGQPNMEQQVRHAVALAAKLGLPVVATHPVQFLSPDEFIAHEARTCIAEGEMLANGRRVRRFNDQQCFKSQAEMAALFADLPAALQNSVEIAKRCNLTLDLGKPQLPNFPTPPSMTIDEFLVAEAKAGLELRLIQLYPEPAACAQQRQRYEDRLKFETDTIIKMGFPGYFLIVAEFIRWAKENGVPVGPGRGSGAGSLVAYSLLITDLDPLEYNLLFERFLNPERVSMPDFDIDFCQEGRDRVIQHVKDLYGKEAVSQIATFGTMAAKGAIRDVGRVLDFGYNFCDGISKLIPFKPGKPVTIADAIKEEPLLAERLDNEEEVRQLLDLAQQVEGIARNIGMHAGGVLIAPGKLTDFCPLYTQGGDANVVSQYDKYDVEAVGLVKFDFLGLTTLTILDRAVRYIKQLDPAQAGFELARVPLDDKASYDLLTKAKTVAVFQLESRGMQGMLKDARPDRFEDIIALVALYRPGPMDLIPDFCKRKHGERFDYPDPRTEGILSETYGIMVYQEQVMQMAQVVGGYSLGGADMLRRAMGKKDAREMAEHRQIFRAGAAKDGLSEAKADEIFDLMEKFAGYGFNKSHAAAYALLSYHTAYLKAHHTAAFIAANLSLAMDDTDKIKILVVDAIEVCGLTLLAPDINLSDYRFTPDGAPPSVTGKRVTQIRYGLGAVKGSGQSAIEAIVAARSSGPFTDLFDFCKRVDKRQINRRTIDSLIRGGAFDCFKLDRAILLASVAFAMECADQYAKAVNQVSLFGGDDSDMVAPPDYVTAIPWSDKQRLTEEKIALGFYLSGHLFDSYAPEARRFARTKLSELDPSREPRMMAGIIVGIRTQMTHRGKILIVALDDKSAVVEVTVYSEVFDANKRMFKEDEFLAVVGKVSEDRFSGGLRIAAEKVFDIVAARIEFGQQLGLILPAAVASSRICEVLQPHRSETGLPVAMRIQAQGVDCTLRFGDQWRVAPSDALQAALEQALGAQDVAVEY
jgi:DNA polymerase III subunit alpha